MRAVPAGRSISVLLYEQPARNRIDSVNLRKRSHNQRQHTTGSAAGRNTGKRSATACQHRQKVRVSSRGVSLMKLLSVNCGLPREVKWHGKTVTTGIYKEPVKGRVALREPNLDGDRQADLRVHGGKNKAVYCYQVAHYDYWRAQLPGRELPMGTFGENFTIEGPPEDSIHIGDTFSVGSAEVLVTQPRLPCYKLGVRFESEDMVKRFLAARRTGFYLAVLKEGDVGAGDEIVPISSEPDSVLVSDITRLYVTIKYENEDIPLLQRALGVRALPDNWKRHFRERLQSASA